MFLYQKTGEKKRRQFSRTESGDRFHRLEGKRQCSKQSIEREESEREKERLSHSREER